MYESKKYNLILRLIKEQCKAERIAQKQLCYGICDPAYISRCISNNIEMDKLMLDAIMQRLGISTRRYEYILRESEYGYFEIREKIRGCIQDENLKEAKKLIEKYMKMQSEMKSAKKMHLQAALLLQSYVFDKEEKDYTVQIQNCDKALGCTLPEYEKLDWEKVLLSESELLLFIRKAGLLEKRGYIEDAYKLYMKLYDIQKRLPYDKGELIHVFVVADYHLAKICMERKDYPLVIRICWDALEMLSKQNKILFVAELTEMYNRAVLTSDEKKSEHEIFYNYKAIKNIIQKYYKEWNPEGFCPMYRELNVHSFRKMIVQRRKLLGLTQEGLSLKCCCDIATIERLEQGKADTQSDIAYQILDTVGLPIEKCFYLLETDSYIAKIDFLQSAVEINRGNTEVAKNILSLVKEKINMQLSINKQAVGFEEFLVDRMEKNIEPEEQKNRLLDILNQTISIKTFRECNNIILYANEIDIVRNIVMCYEKLEKREQGILILENIRNGYVNENVIGDVCGGMALGISKLLESLSANAGNFVYANNILDNCLKKTVEQDIAGLIPQYLYDKIWNRVKQGKEVRKGDYEELEGAYEIAIFSRNKYLANSIKTYAATLK